MHSLSVAHVALPCALVLLSLTVRPADGAFTTTSEYTFEGDVSAFGPDGSSDADDYEFIAGPIAAPLLVAENPILSPLVADATPDYNFTSGGELDALLEIDTTTPGELITFVNPLSVALSELETTGGSPGSDPIGTTMFANTAVTHTVTADGESNDLLMGAALDSGATWTVDVNADSEVNVETTGEDLQSVDHTATLDNFSGSILTRTLLFTDRESDITLSGEGSATFNDATELSATYRVELTDSDVPLIESNVLLFEFNPHTSTSMLSETEHETEHANTVVHEYVLRNSSALINLGAEVGSEELFSFENLAGADTVTHESDRELIWTLDVDRPLRIVDFNFVLDMDAADAVTISAADFRITGPDGIVVSSFGNASLGLGDLPSLTLSPGFYEIFIDLEAELAAEDAFEVDADYFFDVDFNLLLDAGDRSTVPEPATAGLALLGLVGLVCRRRSQAD